LGSEIYFDHPCDRQEKCDPLAGKKLIHQRQEKSDPLWALRWKKSDPPMPWSPPCPVQSEQGRSPNGDCTGQGDLSLNFSP
jgi:hypothetical protein